MSGNVPRPSRGVHIERRSAGVEAWLLGVALVFVLAAIAVSVYVMSAPVDLPELPDAASEPEDFPHPGPSAAPRDAPWPRAELGDAPGAAGDEPAEGEPTGIALFPPPGTDPPKVGIVVPEGFELPPGYVRHYQSTDDGEALAAILMFHPDFQPRDERGQPLPVPADRVVPPELAPPGMPLQMLELPEPEHETP